MRNEERDVYVIPPNFIEGGTLLGGMFKTRNVIEAGVLGLLVGLPVLNLGISLTTRVIILCLTALPLVLVALIGISGNSSVSCVTAGFLTGSRRRIAGSRKSQYCQAGFVKNKRSRKPRNRRRCRSAAAASGSTGKSARSPSTRRFFHRRKR